ncbi:response regulator transcription factor [Paenibacillus qinlingensis]|uniref:response regulator transcription factor n=1 Tax=Paenibacillus qinlingensis TaxID=1837343 RepID=UPI001564E39F|nr:response regulator transcription factor [Paenibacillus qinlingensis]NQX59763.1 response regulator transcription factor [Paenibacillus qinlingensis]
MLKVLLVDDEPVIRAGLAQLIHWEKYGFTIVAKAKNGEQALQLMLEDTPDLIVTDIRMPKMDGLQLIQAVREERNLQTPVIILTGFNEFDYARQAIRYQVRDYLLKPVDKEELIAALTRIRASLRIDNALPVDSQSGNAIKLLLRSTTSHDNKIHLCQTLKAHYPVLLMVITLQKHTQTTFPLIHQLLLPVWEAFRLSEASVRIYIDADGFIALVIQPESAHLSKTEEKQLAFAMLHAIHDTLDQEAFLSVGPLVHSPELLADSFQAACSASIYSLYLDRPTVLAYEDIKLLSPFKSQYEYLASFQLLKESIENNSPQDMERIVLDIFDFFVEQFISPDTIKVHLYRFLLEIEKYVAEMNGDIQPIIKAANHIDLTCTTTPIRIQRKTFLETCRQIGLEIAFLRVQQNFGIIDQIEQYVNSHFHENMTLKDVAAKFYMNHAYLGQLFRRKKEIHFNEYLHQVRIEEAKGLLRRTDLKIAEVAKKVGYNDPTYFSGKFEKHVGVTPTVYKLGLQPHNHPLSKKE